MKKVITILLFMVISAISFGQPTTTSTLQLKANYLKKSKYQKTVARILLYGGAACWVICFFIMPKIKWGPHGGEAIFYTTFGVGLIAMPESILFFSRSARYKKKAMSLSFKNESVQQIQKSSFVYKYLPSLSLKVSL